MHPSNYDTWQHKVSQNVLKLLAIASCRYWAVQEKGLAVENRAIDNNGLVQIRVETNASYCELSFGTQYNSHSGGEAVVGTLTKNIGL